MARWNYSAMERFSSRVAYQSNGCWEWTGNKKAGGYGRFYYQGKKMLSHRYIYQVCVAPLNPSKELHHLCENPSCVNPSHLVEINRYEHFSLTVQNPAHQRFMQTHCKSGHEFTTKNTYCYTSETGRLRRSCRSCRNNRVKLFRQKRKEEV